MIRHFGRATLCGLAALALLARADEKKPSAAGATPPALIPAEDFAREPDLNALRLSPDGKYIAYLFTRKGRGELGMLDLATNRARSFAPGRSEIAGRNMEIRGFDWLSSKRLLVWTSSWRLYDNGLATIDRSLSDWLGLTGAIRWETQRKSAEIIETSSVLGHKGHDPHRVLLNDFERHGAGRRAEWLPNVLEMDATDGRSRTVLRNPGNVSQWMDDWDGNVRFGVIKGEQKTDPHQLIVRAGPDAPWQPARTLGEHAKRFWISGVSAAGDALYLTREGASRRWELASLDLKTGQVAEKPLFRAGDYDLTPPEWIPHFAGEPLAKEIYSRGFKRLLGVRYVTDGPHEYWFASDLEAVQQQLQTMHPDKVNLIVSMDDEVKRLVVLSFSARESGVYSLVDLEAKQVREIGRRCPWIKPAAMADTYPVACEARDGLKLHGYLTLPSGRDPRRLPMVTLVHGGPWVRDVWGFDPVVQFLANRGYAVLQVNYRGSSGYGQDFLEQGHREIGGKIQDDITDFTSWVVRQGIADPQRLAVMGASYGGYSTLFALAHEPGLYRCGVAIAAVTDWSLLWKFKADDAYKEAYRYWSERVGDMEDSATQERLARVSPLNLAAEIKAPVLLVHGKEDYNVPLDQAQKMAAALERAGHPPRTLYFAGLGHAFPVGEDGARFLKEIEQFLAANLAEGAAPAKPTAAAQAASQRP